MANPIKGEVARTIDGDEYVFVMDVNSCCELEALTGRKTSDLVPLVGTGDMTVLRAFVWAACRVNHGDVDLAEAGRLINEIKPPAASALILEIMRLAFPAPEAGKTKARPPKGARAKATGKAGISSAS